VEDHDFTQVEGAELTARASGPMPTGAHEHLSALLRSAYNTRLPKQKRPQPEALYEIVDPVIASAFELADQDLAAVEEEFARRQEERNAEPVTESKADVAERMLAELAKQIRKVARAAERDGVRFVIRKRDAE